MSTYDSSWNFLDYHVDTSSAYVAVAACPSETQAAALPKVGYSAYASLDAAFDAARGGGSVMLPVQSSIDTATKTVTATPKLNQESSPFRKVAAEPEEEKPYVREPGASPFKPLRL